MLKYYVLGAAVTIGVGPLIVRFMTEKLANFKPAYGTAFLATLIGYLANSAIGFLIRSAIALDNGEVSGMGTLLTAVIGLLVYAAFYSFMLKSPEGTALGYGRACIVSLVMSIGTGLINAVAGFIVMMFTGAAGGRSFP